MTPPEFDTDVVQARLRLIDELLADLIAIGTVTGETLREDRITRHAVERVLTQLIELAVSVNSHVAAARLGRAPASFRESFALAADAGAISRELAARLAPSAGFRDLLVHEYGAIDLDRVAAVIPVAANDYRDYVISLARFLSTS